MYQADSWEDMKDDAGNNLNIGQLEYKTKHGKKPGSFLDEVFPRDVNSLSAKSVLAGEKLVATYSIST